MRKKNVLLLTYTTLEQSVAKLQTIRWEGNFNNQERYCTHHNFFLNLILINQPKKTSLPLKVFKIKKKNFLKYQKKPLEHNLFF